MRHTGLPPVAATCEPRLAYRASFTGAVLPVCGVEILIVVVQPRIMFDTYEANLYVTAFNLRFRRTIVLMSQDDATYVPTYYGPAGIVRALCTLPFEMIPWQRMLYRLAKPASWQLPIPPERPSDQSIDASATSGSSIEELSQTLIRDPDRGHAVANRMAMTTRR